MNEGTEGKGDGGLGLKELWMVAMEVEVEEAEGQGKWRGAEIEGLRLTAEG